MQAYETSATVEKEGQVRVVGVPFPPGTPVEVTISPQRRSPAEFVAAWRHFCEDLRRRPDVAELGENEIQQEIKDYRAAR